MTNDQFVKTKTRTLKKDTAYVYLGHFLRYLSPLILIPYYSRVLGPQAYGQVLAAVSLMTIVALIVNYGFIFSGIREVAAAGNDEERSHVLGKQFTARLLLLPIAALIGIVGTLCSSVLVENYWLGISGTLLGIINGFGVTWFFQGIRQFKRSIALEALVYPINILLAIILVRGQEDGVNAILSLIVSSFVCLVVSCFYLRRVTILKLGPIRSGIKEIKDTTIFFITAMSATFLMSGSTYILSIMSSSHEVGYYGVAERFISFGIGLLNPIGQVLMPTITNLHKSGSNQVYDLVRKGFLLEAAYGALAPIIGILIAPTFIPLLLGEAFRPAVLIFQVMVCILPFTAIKHALILYLLIPMKKEKYYMITSVVNLVANLGIALVTVPLYGAMGMVTARIIAEICATLCLVVFSMRGGWMSNLAKG